MAKRYFILSTDTSMIDFSHKRVLLFCSGNLAAETMALVHAELSRSLQCTVTAITDGVLYATVCDSAILRIVNPETPDVWLCEADLFISGIRSPGNIERQWIRAAQRLAVPTIVVLSDIGSGSTKFKDERGWALPDVLAVPDQITWDSLKEASIPENILYPLGSPYLDAMSERPLHFPNTPNRITLFDMPNKNDFISQGLPLLYSELDIIRDFTETMNELGGVYSVIRPHPKQRMDSSYQASLSSLKAGSLHTSIETLQECISSSKVVVSSYSTCLLLAQALGRHAISYQPNTRNNAVRRDLYRAAEIPIVAKRNELTSILRRMLLESDPPGKTTKFLFNGGRSLSELSLLVRKILTGAWC